ncbi:MAG TPA: L-histidine N(alpha)-methyltransferase, partial [Acidobacteriota bacterium]|nr:L-histidine N(alpha)-methyltransferase [Acidobacteriota bacterium]
MMPRESFAFFDYQPQLDNLFTEVVTGLSHLPKHLPAKLFYDQRGSELFEEICRLEEYYLTRTELGILRRHAQEMASLLGDHCLLIEYGSGNSRKIRLLLDQLNHASAVYMPIDISKEHLKQAASQLAGCYPHLEIVAVC